MHSLKNLTKLRLMLKRLKPPLRLNRIVLKPLLKEVSKVMSNRSKRKLLRNLSRKTKSEI